MSWRHYIAFIIYFHRHSLSHCHLMINSVSPIYPTVIDKCHHRGPNPCLRLIQKTFWIECKWPTIVHIQKLHLFLYIRWDYPIIFLDPSSFGERKCILSGKTWCSKSASKTALINDYLFRRRSFHYRDKATVCMFNHDTRLKRNFAS